jgi:hypothetical protein
LLLHLSGVKVTFLCGYCERHPLRGGKWKFQGFYDLMEHIVCYHLRNSKHELNLWLMNTSR